MTMHGSRRVGIVALASLTTATPAAAATLRVPQDHSTIQAGVTAAAPGDTVLVAEGRYPELIRMKNGIVLRSASGPDSTILESPGLAEKIVQERIIECYEGIEGSTVIEGLTFESGGILGTAIHCERGSPTIRGNVIRGLGIGMKLLFNESLVEGNLVEGCSLVGIMVRASTTRISGNTIRNNNGHGIVIAGKESRPVIGGSPEATNRIYGNFRSALVNESRNEIDATWNDWGYEVTAEMNRKGYPADIIAILDGNEHGRQHRGRGKVDYRNWIKPKVGDEAAGAPRVLIPAGVAVTLVAAFVLISRRRASSNTG